MFILPEFHALQCQRCKDLLVEAERVRLALEVEQAQAHHNRISGAVNTLLVRLSDMIHHT